MLHFGLRIPSRPGPTGDATAIEWLATRNQAWIAEILTEDLNNSRVFYKQQLLGQSHFDHYLYSLFDHAIYGYSLNLLFIGDVRGDVMHIQPCLQY